MAEQEQMQQQIKQEEQQTAQKQPKVSKHPAKQVVIERVYTIPLRKAWLRAPKYKRSKRAITEIKKFTLRHMKIYDKDEARVKIGRWLNEAVWSRGIKKPPHKISVKMTRDSDAVKVELSELPRKAVKEALKKSKAEKKKLEEQKQKKEEKKQEEKSLEKKQELEEKNKKKQEQEEKREQEQQEGKEEEKEKQKILQKEIITQSKKEMKVKQQSIKRKALEK